MGTCPEQPDPGTADTALQCTTPRYTTPWLAALAMLVGACVSPGASAQATLDAPPAPHAPSASSAPDCALQPAPSASTLNAQAHYEQLGAHCLRSAQYYRQYGQWLLQHHNPAAAIEALERALLLEPEHLGTQLDYSQALLAAGDTDSAQALLASLRAQPDVPPHLLPLMDWQLLALQTPPPASAPTPGGITTRTVFSQSLGADSNLNNATTATNVTLTFPEADLSLPVAQAFRPQDGLAATTALQWTGLIPQGQSLWLLQAEGRARHTASSAHRYMQGEFQATWLQNPAASAQWIARMEHARLFWSGRKLYSSQRLGLQRQWAHTLNSISCRTAAGLEVENRDYSGSRTLDGQYLGAVLTLLCQNNGNSFNLQLRAGQDNPSHASRVGGEQRQAEARAQWQFKGLGNQWLAEYSVQHQQDATGYSPLLLRNAARRVTRQSVRLETSRPTQWPALGSPQWFASLELTHQASNLQAFGSNRKAVQTGLRWAWP